MTDVPSSQSLAVPPRGNLEEMSPFRLYYLIAAAESSGLLWLGEGTDGVGIWMKNGTPQAVQCEGLRLDAFLLEIGTLKPAQLEAAAPFIARAGGDVLTGLFSAGVLNPSETFPLIQQHALAVLWRGLALQHGPFTYDPSVAPPASAFPLGNRWQILSNAARKLDRVLVSALLRPHEGQAPILSGSTSDLALTAQETRVIAQMDGSRSLSTLVQQLGAEGDVVLRLSLFLQEIDRLSWVAPTGKSAVAPPPPVRPAVGASAPQGGQSRVAPTPAASAPPRQGGATGPKSSPQPAAPRPPAAATPPKVEPTAPPPAASPTSPAVSMTVPEFQQFLAELKQKDFFARLGVSRGKGAMPSLKANYLQLAKLYHPDTVAQDAPPEMRSLRAEVLAFLNEAYQELSDDAKRAHYYAELLAAEEIGDMNIEAILQSEEQFQRATHFFKARKYQEAFDLFDGCIKMNDREGEFYAWRGYSRFLASTNKREAHAEAQADLRRALELNRRCVAAYLFDGHMSKLLEAHAEAQKSYHHVLELEPGNVEAQRELRLYEQRRR